MEAVFDCPAAADDGRERGVAGLGEGQRGDRAAGFEPATRPPEEIALWEQGLLAVSRRWFAGIHPGDDIAIGVVLAREHPVY